MILWAYRKQHVYSKF